MKISDDVLCFFSAQVRKQDGSYVIELPERELSLGNLTEDGTYQVALASHNPSEHAEAREPVRNGHKSPVEKGDQRRVEIIDIGEQGDGIARIERGYVLIVLDTELYERVTVRITSVKANLAFSEIVERDEYYQELNAESSLSQNKRLPYWSTIHLFLKNYYDMPHDGNRRGHSLTAGVGPYLVVSTPIIISADRQQRSQEASPHAFVVRQPGREHRAHRGPAMRSAFCFREIVWEDDVGAGIPLIGSDRLELLSDLSNNGSVDGIPEPSIELRGERRPINCERRCVATVSNHRRSVSVEMCPVAAAWEGKR